MNDWRRSRETSKKKCRRFFFERCRSHVRVNPRKQVCTRNSALRRRSCFTLAAPQHSLACSSSLFLSCRLLSSLILLRFFFFFFLSPLTLESLNRLCAQCTDGFVAPHVTVAAVTLRVHFISFRVFQPAKLESMFETQRQKWIVNRRDRTHDSRSSRTTFSSRSPVFILFRSVYFLYIFFFFCFCCSSKAFLSCWATENEKKESSPLRTTKLWNLFYSNKVNFRIFFRCASEFLTK